MQSTLRPNKFPKIQNLCSPKCPILRYNKNICSSKRTRKIMSRPLFLETSPQSGKIAAKKVVSPPQQTEQEGHRNENEEDPTTRYIRIRTLLNPTILTRPFVMRNGRLWKHLSPYPDLVVVPQMVAS